MAQQQLSTNTFGTAKWIVSSDATQGTHTTIGSALTSASSGDTIFIRPGTYTENITLKAGVNLAAYGCDGFTPNVIILGNTTASYNGTVTLTGIQLKTNSAACLTVSGSNTSKLILNSCGIDANNATAISVNAANFSIRFSNCMLQSESNNLLFAITATLGMDFQACNIVAGTGASTIAANSVNFFNCKVQFFSVTTSSTGAFNAYNSFFDNSAENQTIFTTVGTGSCVINNCSLFSGTASTLSVGSGTIVSVADCEVSSSNTNAITGSGTLDAGIINFTGSSSTINSTLTTTAYSVFPINKSFDNITVQVFTGSGTYTPTTGMKYCTIEVVGGGGGGGGCAASSGTNVAVGSCGGGGGYARKTVTAATIGSSQTVTVGAAGSGGATGNNNGTAGGTTSVGSIVSATGGARGLGGASGGAEAPASGLGGAGSSGDFNANGIPGGTAYGVASSAASWYDIGSGGSSVFGGGALGFAGFGSSVTNGNNATSYGGGGTGAGGTGSASTGAGGNGFAGIVIITEYVNS